jgi:hypothetical protein
VYLKAEWNLSAESMRAVQFSTRTSLILCFACLALLFLFFALPILHVGLGEDEGVFAVQATRLLQGQLPNLDFPIPYLGGNVFYNALCMRVLGQSFWALRAGLLLIFIFYGLGIFYLSNRLMDRRWALLTTVTVFSMTVGFYPYLNASWNALLFSLGAFIAFIKALEAEKRKPLWLFSCGVSLALSLFMKQTVGLYTAFSLYLIQLLNLTFPDSAETVTPRPSSPVAKILVIVGGLFIAAYLIFLLSPHANAHNWLFFGLPSLCMLGSVWKVLLSGQNQANYRQAVVQLLVVAASAILTLLVLLVPYIARQGLTTYLYEGLILRPGFYIKVFYQDYVLACDGVIFLVLLLFTGGLLLTRKFRIPGLAVSLAGVALFAWSTGQQYDILRNNALLLLYQFPLWLIATGLVFFVKRSPQFSRFARPERLAMAVFIWGVFLYLNTYPVIAIPYVTCNLAPLGIFMGYLAFYFLQKASALCRIPVFLFFGFWTILGGFSVYQYHGQPLQEFVKTPFSQYTVMLPKPHGGLWMTEAEWGKRRPLIEFIRTHSPKQDDFYILADCAPEVYFLTGHNNPTRYDYYLFSLANGTDDLIQALEARKVRYVFIPTSRGPVFPVEPRVLEYIQAHYRPSATLPHWQVFERVNQSHG